MTQETEMTDVINNFIAKIINDGKNYEIHRGNPGHILEINPGDLKKVCRKLKNSDPFHFLYLVDITAVDLQQSENRFQLNYLLHSFEINHRLVIRFKIDAETTVSSVEKIWPAAQLLEDEIEKLFGINFSGWQKNSSLFMSAKFSGFPLRKDYPASARNLNKLKPEQS